MKTKEELKQYFEKGDRPTQSQFWEWIDSYWHKEETVERIIPVVIDGVLWGHSLSITIPSNIKKIREQAFTFFSMSYQISEVNLNEGLEEIGKYAFRGQEIKKLKTPSTLKVIDDLAFDSQANTTYGADALEEVILNEGLITIGNNAFDCPRGSVKDLYIPSSVQSVGQDAFKIPSLQTVSIPSGLDVSNAGIPSTAVIIVRPSEPLPS